MIETESTTELLGAAQAGGDQARERLFAHCRPIMYRWARGRLPHFARDLADTEDLVQVAMLRAWNNLGRFENRRSGSFLAYLRTILLSTVKEELRRSGARPEDTERFEAADDNTDSVLANAIGAEALERYEAALNRLTESQRDAVVLRLEFGLDFRAIADELDVASADAARMLVARAVARLAELMG